MKKGEVMGVLERSLDRILLGAKLYNTIYNDTQAQVMRAGMPLEYGRLLWSQYKSDFDKHHTSPLTHELTTWLGSSNYTVHMYTEAKFCSKKVLDIIDKYKGFSVIGGKR